MSNKDIFSDPTYIVLNVPSPVADEVRQIRSLFDLSRAHLAIEISLCGSNGRGIISPGQDPDVVFAETDAIAAKTKAFLTSFGNVEHFPNTGIFYYTLKNEKVFEELHSLFVNSKIKFEASKFPYEPHCTLKISSYAEYTEKQLLKGLRPPNEDFLIDTISIYSLSKEKHIPRLIHRVNLKS